MTIVKQDGRRTLYVCIEYQLLPFWGRKNTYLSMREDVEDLMVASTTFKPMI
ncbi:hypothetical protein [Bacteroides acidifaciens]|uniref:hypothetical protein n=1 Tax=Bacteroides acidifaciens TaxID=85831 RepID=UPI00242E2E00|nr:hypothetical protein [Bacteroides acidifaciens]